jgi:polyhydroxyalkanoate synthase
MNFTDPKAYENYFHEIAADGMDDCQPQWRELFKLFEKLINIQGLNISDEFDKLAHGLLGRVTMGISPVSIALAFSDWLYHLWLSPGKRINLTQEGIRDWYRFCFAMIHGAVQPRSTCSFVPIAEDDRFDSPEWEKLPYRFIYQGFLLTQEWWHQATTTVHGVSDHHEQVVSFVTRQILDMFSPSNFIQFNPKVLKITREKGGLNLIQGMINWLQDYHHLITKTPPVGTEKFIPGKTVAVTKGEVIYRNSLIELIQYYPTTEKVYTEPILIIPAWIMKYYILDLSPHNSLVKYLIDQGHTVFMISWRNPESQDRNLGMDDYLYQGILDALKVIQAIIPDRRINTVGYCIGGTLLAIAAAYLAREGNTILNSITLLAAQIDFTEAGELTLFIDESQVTFLEDLMWLQGYLDAKQMAGVFQLLKSNDLIWSRRIQEYLTGERVNLNDLMAWSKDSTRMPYRMHSEYLRKLFLNNELFEGKYHIEGKSIALSDIRLPIFSVGTEKDHVAPWRSVYKINLLANCAVTFVLTTGGHNVGIVNEPENSTHRYRISTHKPHEKYIGPNRWFAQAEIRQGSWWIAWADWLAQQNSGQKKPPSLGNPRKGYRILTPAPGLYVIENSS